MNTPANPPPQTHPVARSQGVLGGRTAVLPPRRGGGREADLWPATFRRAPSWVPSVLDPADGRVEAHTMHGCAHTKQVKS